MDLWVVAAAAGAGYIAKNLQNLTVDKNEDLLEPALKYPGNVQLESMNILQQIRYNTCPLRRLEQNRAQEDGELASSSTGISGQRFSEFEDGERKTSRRLGRGKFIRSSRSGLNVARPLISLENDLDYELSKDGEGFEQNMFGMFPSVSTSRPLLVTDGIGLTTRSSSASSLALFDGGVEEGRRENIVGSKVRSTMFRSHSVDHIDSAVLPRKPKKSSGLARMSDSTDGVPHGLFDSSGPNGVLLFIMGMSIGILSAKTTSKREVDSMKLQLKQTHNLVQDLHDELNMKEMITVKEIVNEGYYQPPRKSDTPSSIREPIASPNKEAKELTKFDNFKASYDNDENLKIRSKIEEELQAELEMLEHNISATALENISYIVELDPDYEPDIAQGDLKPMMATETRDTLSESGDKSTGTTTNVSQPPNYAVSPRELCFRLHELIESRLEARIKELEIALSNSENKVRVLGSQGIILGTRLPYSETEYSCSPQSPINICEHYTADGSLVKNISSNSLDSIKEENGILLKATDNDQERGEKSISNFGSDHEMYSTVQKFIDDLFDEEKDRVSHHDAVMEKDGAQEDSVQDMVRTWDRQMSRSLLLDEDFESEDEEEADESEMLLIKKIVERRRSGSAFAFNFDEFRIKG
ncbi:uncharacterized protein LOC142524338 [Primulina tabacum]|uniref:uncharacterized protein LOC142524338 n=1 Tax=Primulina tabacum TaxID=48773 RepID=UPI003F5A2DC7